MTDRKKLVILLVPNPIDDLSLPRTVSTCRIPISYNCTENNRSANILIGLPGILFV